MTKQISFDQIEFVTHGVYDTFPGKLNPIAAAIRGESEMGGGGLGKVLGIALAIAVPFVAPYIAGAIASSALGAAAGATFMAGAGGVLASAATGAVLGGAGSALTGGDWRRGALFGGLGSGFTQGMGGFGSTNNPVFGSATTQNAGFFGPQGTAVYGQGASNAVAQGADDITSLAGAADDVTAANATLQGQPQTLQATNASGVSNTLSTQPSVVSPNASLTATPGVNTVAAGSTPSPYSLYQPGATLTNPAGGVSAGTGVGLRAPAGFDLAARPTTFTGELAARFTNPSRLADMAIMSTPQIIGQVYATQAGKEQQDRIDAYQKELKALEGKDQAAYELKRQEAESYIANAKNINPSYWAQMSANQANITGARRLAESYRDAPMAGLRDLSGERRRDALALTQNVGTAYNQGYQSGVGMRDQGIRTGYSMIPNAPRTALEGQRQVAGMYADLDNTRAAAAQGASQTASYFTYPFLSNYRNERV
jgi:hypothetical protein